MAEMEHLSHRIEGDALKTGNYARKENLSNFVEVQRYKRRRRVTGRKNAVEIDYYMVGESVIVLEIWNKTMKEDTGEKVT